MRNFYSFLLIHWNQLRGQAPHPELENFKVLFWLTAIVSKNLNTCTKYSTAFSWKESHWNCWKNSQKFCEISYLLKFAFLVSLIPNRDGPTFVLTFRKIEILISYIIVKSRSILETKFTKLSSLFSMLTSMTLLKLLWCFEKENDAFLYVWI